MGRLNAVTLWSFSLFKLRMYDVVNVLFPLCFFVLPISSGKELNKQN